MRKIYLQLFVLFAFCNILLSAGKDKYPVPEPEPIKTGINIAAYYLTGWGIKNQFKRCQDLSIGTEYHPILGKYKSNDMGGTYDASDPEIVDWHIKWAVENGINIFVIEYMYHLWDWEKNFEKGFFNAKYLDYIKFAIQLDSTPFYDSYSNLKKKTIEVVEYLSKNYFNKKQYYKINDKPVMFFYHAQVFLQKFGKNKLKELVADIYNTAEKNGYKIFLVGDAINNSWVTDQENDYMIRLFDAVSTYNIPDAGSKFQKNNKGHSVCISGYKDVVNGYIKITKQWADMVKKHNKKIIPTVIPGFSNRIMYEKGYDDWIVQWNNLSPEEFMRMCKSIKPYIDNELNLLVVEAWNELHEGSVLEPTVENGFKYLNIIREVFGIKGNKVFPENIYPK